MKHLHKVFPSGTEVRVTIEDSVLLNIRMATVEIAGKVSHRGIPLAPKALRVVSKGQELMIEWSLADLEDARKVLREISLVEEEIQKQAPFQKEVDAFSSELHSQGFME